MRTGEVLGAEALIRWQHPERGLLGPAHFLPAIENNALAIEVGQWVVHTAIQQMVNWQAQGLNLPVSVNMDAQLLQQPDVMSWLTTALARYPTLPPGNLQLEVLETSALDDMVHVSDVMRRVAAKQLLRRSRHRRERSRVIHHRYLKLKVFRSTIRASDVLLKMSFELHHLRRALVDLYRTSY
jgi:predicted signal transduction protein with EAL and GGDEF domain